MINIRNGLFETNSSSVHSLVMCTKDEYDAWKNGKKVFDKYMKEVVNTADVDMTRIQYLTFEQYEDMLDNCYYEEFFREKDGIVAFGYYGHD